MLDQLEELDEADFEEVRALVEEHVRAHRLAGRASACSTTGTSCCRKFVKVFPPDYKRVLGRSGRQRASGVASESRSEVAIDG